MCSDLLTPSQVLLSFILTAIFTFGAIVLGYFTNSIPATTLNRIDRLIVTKAKALLSRIGSSLRQEKRKSVNNDADAKALKALKKRRSEALEKFILTLSDQQLVTGLAILIAGYTRPCTISQYHFNIIAALAWFSSTTHLATLAVLRDYLIGHPVVRTWRVVGMVIMLVILMIAQFVQFFGRDLGAPAKCVFSNPIYGMPILVWIDFVVILNFLLFSYGNSVVHLYANDSTLSIMAWVSQKLKQRFGRSATTVTVLLARYEASVIPYAIQSSSVTRYRERHRDMRLIYGLRSLQALHSEQWNVKCRCELMFLVYIHHELMDSFFWRILWLIFGNTYGIIQIVVYRWSYQFVQIDGNEDDMGFGQIVPLLLLGLPVLAAGEVYYGMTAT